VSAKEIARPFSASGMNFRCGCYSLVIKLPHARTLRVGKLGAAVFPKGTYIYTGSAMNGLAARLRRHSSRNKKLHWHIDYLLALSEARIERVLVYPPGRNQECRQNQRIGAEPGATLLLKQFGASDCKSGCASHLFYFAKSAVSRLRWRGECGSEFSLP